MSVKTIPTKINKYNVYNAGNRLLGMGDELPLPKFEASGETVNGAGVLGEFEDPTVGYFNNMELEIPFRVFDPEAVDMLDMNNAVQLELRGAQQATNSESDVEYRQIRVVVRGRMINFDPGKTKAAAAMECTVTLSVTYTLIELDGKPMVELDKLNEAYKVRGVDVLATIKEMC